MKNLTLIGQFSNHLVGAVEADLKLFIDNRLFDSYYEKKKTYLRHKFEMDDWIRFGHV